MGYNVEGGGVNKQCLPNDTENGHAFSVKYDALYGSGYEVSGAKPSGLP